MKGDAEGDVVVEVCSDSGYVSHQGDLVLFKLFLGANSTARTQLE